MIGLGDFHTHTVHSHGKGRVRDNVLAARRRGLRQVGISDHGPANLFGVGIAGMHVFDTIREEIRRLQQELDPDLQVFLGVEANVVDLRGTLDVPLEVLRRLDYVMAGLHVPVRTRRVGDAVRFAAYNVVGRWWPEAGRRARIMNTEALVQAVHRYPIDVITHPGWRLSVDTAVLAEACAAVGTALEVNTSHDHGGVAYIRVAAERGVDFVVGSDAHAPDRVGDLQAGFQLLREAGVPAERVRNAVTREGKLSSAAEVAILKGKPIVRSRP